MRNAAPTAVLCFAALSLVAAAGCKPKESSSAPAAAPGAPRPEQAKQFVETLRKMPPGERQSYVSKHPELAQGVNNSGDPKLLGDFMQLMKEAGPN
jgi:hypothetical protein